MKNNKPSKPLSTIPAEFDYSYFQPLEVKVQNDNIERAIKIFKSMVQGEKVLSLYKQKQSYEKPSEKKRRKKNEALQRAFEAEVKAAKIASGEYEKERLRKQLKKEKKRTEREAQNKIEE